MEESSIPTLLISHLKTYKTSENELSLITWFSLRNRHIYDAALTGRGTIIW